MSNFVVQTKLYWINGPLQGMFSRKYIPVGAESPDAESAINEFLSKVGSVYQEEKNKALIDSVAVFEPGGQFKVGVVNCVSGLKMWINSSEGEYVEW